ncbi:MAG: OB-fold domain-containing protein [Candidatus Binatia bacterium]|nr:OB-fold domain-containing protein [Candidatus Binatia bacterium]
MVGIAKFSAYVPRLRLSRAEIARAWGKESPSAGEIAVANYDEDAFTLALEAALICLESCPHLPEGWFFASTSPPYFEKQLSAFGATVCDLPRETFCSDFGGSARAGLQALLAADAAVRSGRIQSCLVSAAEARLAEPESEWEGLLGDGAAAVLVARENVAAEIVGSASISEEFTYFWRTDASPFVSAYPGKFSQTYGYVRDVAEAIHRLLSAHNLQPSQVARLVLHAPEPRAAVDVARKLSFDPTRQLAPTASAAIGSVGAAESLLALGGVLDEAEPNQWIVVAAFGEGADAVLLRTTALVGDGRAGPSWKDWLAAKQPLRSYQKYLKYRGLMRREEVEETITNVLEFKELAQNVRLHGSRCRHCATVQYPLAQVCISCGRPGPMDELRLGLTGTVFTYTVDHLIANVEHPLPMAVVELDGGGRIYLQVTDFTEGEVDVGRRVRLTFRRIHEGGQNHNYFWKARPIR